MSIFFLIFSIDFVVNYLVEDSTNPALDGMEFVILGYGEEITGHMERITPTSWKYHQVIQL